MYKIIGADGKEYGPISEDELRRWITEGRANLQTKICSAGTSEWKTLAAFPELACPPPIIASMPFAQANASEPSARANAEQTVKGPAIALIVVAVLNFAVASFVVVMALTATMNKKANFPVQDGSIEAWKKGMSWQNSVHEPSPLGVLGSAFTIVASVFILYGGLKMKKLESRGLCLGTTIVAMVPCITTLWFIGLPLGIWAVVVLNKPEVKKYFV